ncbi:hypothetical protein HDU96_003180 [Phlyctochytrium bullatum]|nr:hypothetical protein HDU96_003180 [Phlyctochytrium bullatum]
MCTSRGSSALHPRHRQRGPPRRQPHHIPHQPARLRHGAKVPKRLTLPHHQDHVGEATQFAGGAAEARAREQELVDLPEGPENFGKDLAGGEVPVWQNEQPTWLDTYTVAVPTLENGGGS